MAKTKYVDEQGLIALIQYIQEHYADKDDTNLALEELKTNSGTDTQEKVDALEQKINAKIESLPHESQEQIQELIDNSIAKVVDGAPEAFDSLKEIADWIQSDETGTTALINRVAALEDKVHDPFTKEEVTQICESIIGALSVASEDGLAKAFASGSDTVKLSSDTTLTNPVEVPENTTLTLDLNGKTLMTAKKAPIKVTKGSVVTLKNGTLASPNGAAIKAEGEGAKIVLDGAIIDSSTAGNGVEVSEGGTVEVNSGVIKAREAGIFPHNNATVVINGGHIEGIDNAGIMPSGSKDKGGYDITINDGEIVGNIVTPGFVACAIYQPNSGTITINGGDIKAINGAGIVVRGGTVNVNGGTITGTGDSSNVGKVGDSRVVVPAGSAIVYDSDSKYPDAANMKLVIGKDAKLVGELVELGDASGVTDNRAAE